MRDIAMRLVYKLTGHKAIFTAAILILLMCHEFSATNATIMQSLVYAVLGAKAAQYIAGGLSTRDDTQED